MNTTSTIIPGKKYYVVLTIQCKMHLQRLDILIQPWCMKTHYTSLGDMMGITKMIFIGLTSYLMFGQLLRNLLEKYQVLDTGPLAL